MSQSRILGRIALSDRHLAEAKERIARQRLHVANSIGLANARALDILNTYLGIQDQMKIHRSILEEELSLRQGKSARSGAVSGETPLLT